MVLGFTEPVTEANTKFLPRDNGRPAGKADKHTATHSPIVQTSHNSVGLRGPLRPEVHFLCFTAE
jgi:hypothetical protein